METHAHTNHLIGETSPYLLQHAHNPVQWYPWGDEALAKARREDKPILLSIGYSACHWCHVMEHESFEDEDVARVMNELFVCIKVDREERPDLDKIYQTAFQLLMQRAGGWPLNMFLTPDDHLPFFGGTYFPKTPKYGMPAFADVLRQIAGTYRDRKPAIREQNESLRAVFARLQPPAEDMPLRPEILDQARAQLKTQFDARYGGFGGAPKFPHPTSIDFLLREWARSAVAGRASADTLRAAQFTLQSMAAGGIYDQLGGGFYRYSVDERWMIPHFEKMLYDNALLLPLYADLAQVTGAPLYRRVIAETAAWVMGEMQSPEGGYYSTLDADSEGHEGKFYVWTVSEIRALLTAEEWEVVRLHYGLDGQPNFEGAWHLNVHTDIPAVAERLQMPEARAGAHLAAARAKLFAARAQRVRPARDEKILTSWNGLMIKAMAHAGWIMRDGEMITSAVRAFDFVRANLWRNRRLLATTKDGKAHLNAYLDDYVFLIDAGLELLQARFRADDLAFLVEVADVLLEQFADPLAGGFYFTGKDHEQLAYRPKPTTDDATPSGNGIAARVLLRLGHVLGETRYIDAAERTLEAMGPAIAQYPSGHGALLMALQEYLDPPQTIVLRGRAPTLPVWEARCFARYAPARLTLAIPDDVQALPGVLAARKPLGEIAAYVCTGHACQAPVTTLAEFEKVLTPPEVKAPDG